MRTHHVLALLAVLVCVGCEAPTPTDESTPTTAAQTNTSQAEEPTKPAVKKMPSAADEVDALLAEVAEKCTFSSSGAIGKCKDRQLQRKLTGTITKHRSAALVPLTAALKSPDERIRRLSAKYIGTLSVYHLEDVKTGKATLERETALALLAHVSTGDPSKDPTIAPVAAAATIAAGLANTNDELRAMFDALDASKGPAWAAARASAIEQSMVVRGLAAFPLVEEATTSKLPDLQRAGYRATLNMKAWEYDAQEKLCPWLGDALPKMRGEWDAMPARALMHGCLNVEVWHVRALDEALARAKRHRLVRPFATIIPEFCQVNKPTGNPFRTNPIVCEKTREVLLAAVAQKKLDDQDMAIAIRNLTDTFPDATSRKAIEKLKRPMGGPAREARKYALGRLPIH